jgi:hypothetical protein
MSTRFSDVVRPTDFDMETVGHPLGDKRVEMAPGLVESALNAANEYGR